MNFLDIVLICIVAVFVLRGFFRGLVKEVLSLIAIVLAIYLASNYQQVLVPHLQIYIENEITVSALAYVTIFFGTLIVFWLLAKAIRSFLNIALLGWVDRVSGGIFGAIEGGLIALLLLMFLYSFAPDSAWITESWIAPRSQHLMELTSDLAPESMSEALKSKGFKLPTPEEALESAKEAIGLDDKGEPQQ